MQIDLKEKTKLFSEENKCKDFDEDCDDDICATSCWLYQPERGWCPLLNISEVKMKINRYKILKDIVYNLPFYMTIRRATTKSKTIRKDTGMRQAAKEVGISLATYQRAENGKEIEVSTLLLIMKWLENSPDVKGEKNENG